MVKISAVINTLNEEEKIERVLKTLSWVDEIVVVDDGSADKTLEIARKFTNKIYKHKSVGFVEPARNFAISKATGDWILLVDADEEIPETLSKKLKEIAEKMKEIDYVELPRANMISGKWMKASMWWPDYNIRFFKKAAVKWSNKIHSNPKANGEGIKLDPEKELAILHHNYDNFTSFIERMNRYSTIQAKELSDTGIKFHWLDLIEKPLGEFLSRFFANRGYEDGLHGLALSLLQAFSFLVVYCKLWELEGSKEEEINLKDFEDLTKKSAQEINYWFKFSKLSKNPFKRFIQKVSKS